MQIIEERLKSLKPHNQKAQLKQIIKEIESARYQDIQRIQFLVYFYTEPSDYRTKIILAIYDRKYPVCGQMNPNKEIKQKTKEGFTFMKFICNLWPFKSRISNKYKVQQAKSQDRIDRDHHINPNLQKISKNPSQSRDLQVFLDSECECQNLLNIQPSKLSKYQ